MADEYPKLASLLVDLETEADQLQAEIEQMIGDMAMVPEAQRQTGDWSASGIQTKRYLELTERLSAVEDEMTAVKREMAKLPGGLKPN
jgi:uncharacterized protein Yka (UPF0111/DUF47 family)